jgi:transcriptional regulator with XRE-family HTH domain
MQTTMENLIGNRIKTLRQTYNLGIKDFASYCGLSHVAIFHLENGKTVKPHRSSLQRIANQFGTSINWLLYGEDNMLPNGKAELTDQKETEEAAWKETAYQELKNANRLLEKEVERLWQVVQHLQLANHKPFAHMKEAG